MKNVILKNGFCIDLYTADEKDAQQVVDFYNEIGGETDYLSFGKNEFPMTEEAEKQHICQMAKSQTDIMLIAKKDKEIVGIATLNSSTKRKMLHNATFGIGIKQSCTGFGLGTIMLKNLIEFAKSNGITKKISLITRSDNAMAIALYKKLGFCTEGTLKKETFENNQYYDSLYMGLFI